MSDRTTARRVELILAGKDEASGVFNKAAGNVKAALDKMQAQHGPFQPIEAEIRKRMEGRLKAMLEGHAREVLEEKAHQRTLAAIIAEGGRSGPLRGDQIDPAGRLARANVLRVERAEAMRRDIGTTVYRDYYGGAFDSAPGGRSTEARPFGPLGGPRNRGGGGEEEGSALENAARSLGRGGSVELFGRLISGGAVSMLGNILATSTEKLKDFAEMLTDGGHSASELTHSFLDSIPIVDGFAKAGENLRLLLDHAFFPERERATRRGEEAKDNRDLREKMRDARDAKRNPIMASNRQAAFDAQDVLNVAGKRGIDRTYAEAENQYNAKLRGIQTDAGKIGALNTDQQDEARKQLALRRKAADAELADQRKQADEQELREQEGLARDHAERIKDLEADSHADRLQLDGKFLTAKLDQITREAEREIAAADKARKDEQRDRAPTDYFYIQSQKRFDASKAEAQKRAADKAAVVNEQDQHERELAEKDHQKEITDIRVSAASKRLRALGGEQLASKLDMGQQHEDQVEAINRRYDEELRTHKERAKDIERQRKEDLSAENDRFGADVFIDQRQRGRQFAAQDTSAGSEARLLTGYRNPGVAADMADRVADQHQTLKEVLKSNQEIATHVAGILLFCGQIGHSS